MLTLTITRPIRDILSKTNTVVLDKMPNPVFFTFLVFVQNNAKNTCFPKCSKKFVFKVQQTSTEQCPIKDSEI